jgi:hypothetical protein
MLRVREVEVKGLLRICKEGLRHVREVKVKRLAAYLQGGFGGRL